MGIIQGLHGLCLEVRRTPNTSHSCNVPIVGHQHAPGCRQMANPLVQKRPTSPRNSASASIAPMIAGTRGQRKRLIQSSTDTWVQENKSKNTWGLLWNAMYPANRAKTRRAAVVNVSRGRRSTWQVRVGSIRRWLHSDPCGSKTTGFLSLLLTWRHYMEGRLCAGIRAQEERCQ